MLLDSVVVIDYLNGIEQAVPLAEDAANVLSVVTFSEVLAGVAPDDFDFTVRLLRRYRVLAVDAAIAERAGRLRQSERWKLPDAFQAALALHHGVKLATRNTKDFKPDRHPFVVVPYTL